MPTLRLDAKINLDKTGFEAGLISAGKSVTKFGGALKAQLAGAFAVSALFAYTRQLINTVGHIKDLSDQTGLSTKSLQELEYAGKGAGVSLDEIARSFKALSKARAEAMQNPKSSEAQVFSALGIGGNELKANTIEQTWRRIAEVFRTTDFGASELVMVEKILGRSGQELLPLFRDNLEELGKEANRVGAVFGDDMVRQIDAVGDAFDRLYQKSRRPLSKLAAFAGETIDLASVLKAGIGGLMAGGVPEMIKRRDAELMRISNEEMDLRSRGGGVTPGWSPRTPRTFDFTPTAPTKMANRLESLPLGNIGVFAGEAAMKSLPPLVRDTNMKLQKLHDAVSRYGILIRDVAR